MELDLKNLASILLFLLPGYFFSQGRERHIAARDLSTFQESAHFVLASISIHLALIFLLTILIDLPRYVDELQSASMADVLRDHIWLITAYSGYSMLLAHYAGRIYGYGFMWLVDHDLDSSRTVIRPTLRNENILLSIMRQRHVSRRNKKRYVFARVHLNDGTMYEGFVMKYSFDKEGKFILYLRIPIRTDKSDSIDIYWENPAFDGVVIRSDSVSAMDISYRDKLEFQRKLIRK
jgi:hypothetical protein